MADYTQGIIIVGITYDVPLVSVKRSFDVLDKYAQRRGRRFVEGNLGSICKL